MESIQQFHIHIKGTFMTTKTKKTNKKTVKSKKSIRTHIVLVIDRSGSMSNKRNEAFEAINAQINTIKNSHEEGDDTRVSYIQFDDQIETVFKDIPANELQNITFDQYVPRGSTSLNDAQWNAINLLKANDAALDSNEDTSFLVIVVTDGWENSSKEITKDILDKEITRLQNTGDWTFTYMVGGVSHAQASITFAATSDANIATFDNNSSGVKYASAGASIGTNAYVTARKSGLKAVNNFYNDEVLNAAKILITKEDTK